MTSPRPAAAIALAEYVSGVAARTSGEDVVMRRAGAFGAFLEGYLLSGRVDNAPESSAVDPPPLAVPPLIVLHDGAEDSWHLVALRCGPWDPAAGGTRPGGDPGDPAVFTGEIVANIGDREHAALVASMLGSLVLR